MSERIVETFTVTVDRPAADVFAVVSDVNNHSKWSASDFRIDEVSDASFATGATFASFGTDARKGENHRNDVTVSTNNSPQEFALTSLDDGDSYINTWRLTESGAATQVDYVVDMPKPGGPMGLMFGQIFKSMIAPRIQENLERFKQVAEA